MSDHLAPRLLDALCECERYSSRGTHYLWRIASMEKLHKIGLVETVVSPATARLGYRPTPRGLEIVRDHRTPLTPLEAHQQRVLLGTKTSQAERVSRLEEIAFNARSLLSPYRGDTVVQTLIDQIDAEIGAP